MQSIGVITRGKYGMRLLDTLIQHTDFIVSSASIPNDLPDFIDEPTSYIDDLDLDKGILTSNLIITFSLHPDITPEIVQRAAHAGTKAIIIPGGLSRAGDPGLLNEISKKYNTRILIEDICCEIESDIDNTINEFASVIGRPELEVRIVNGKISYVEVIRGAPCGSTWWMAEKLIGVPIEEAPAMAGLLIQHYPCRAVRGTKSGIHRSAQLHKEAIEEATSTMAQT